jgi:hypothetical protein
MKAAPAATRAMGTFMTTNGEISTLAHNGFRNKTATASAPAASIIATKVHEGKPKKPNGGSPSVRL